MREKRKHKEKRQKNRNILKLNKQLTTFFYTYTYIRLGIAHAKKGSMNTVSIEIVTNLKSQLKIFLLPLYFAISESNNSSSFPVYSHSPYRSGMGWGWFFIGG